MKKLLAPVLLQWIFAAALLVVGLALLPSFSIVFFVLAAILAAPIRPLRDLLRGIGVRGWMIAAAAALFVIFGFIVSPSKPAAENSDVKAAVTTTAKATTTAMSTTAKSATTTMSPTAKSATTTKATTTATTTKATTTATTTTPAVTRATRAPSNAKNVIEEGGTNKCSRNETVTCNFWGLPDTDYSIDVYYSSKVSEADGLENKTSGADGFVSWTWKIGGNTNTGNRYLEIIGGGETVRIDFEIVDGN